MSHVVYGKYDHEAAIFNATGNGTWVNDTADKVIEVPAGTSSMQMFRMVCELGLSFPLAVLGIIGNLLSMLILGRYKNRQTTIVLLQALAIADTLVLASTICLRSTRYLYPSISYLPVYHYMFRWIYPATYFVRLVGTWLTVLLTVDRFIAVCIPLRANRMCTLTRTYILIAVVVVCSLLFSLPRMFEVTMVTAINPATNATQSYSRMTPLLENYPYNIGYRIVIYFVVMYLVPMILLITLNTSLLAALRKADTQRATLQLTTQLSTNSRNNRSVTVIVVTVVVVCIACNLSAMVSTVLHSVPLAYKAYGPRVDVYRRYATNISNVLVTFNSAINFIIYCLCSRNFRSVLVHTFHCEQVCEAPVRQEQAVLLNRNSSSFTQSTFLRNSIRADKNNGVALKSFVQRPMATNGLLGVDGSTETATANV